MATQTQQALLDGFVAGLRRRGFSAEMIKTATSRLFAVSPGLEKQALSPRAAGRFSYAARHFLNALKGYAPAARQSLRATITDVHPAMQVGRTALRSGIGYGFGKLYNDAGLYHMVGDDKPDPYAPEMFALSFGAFPYIRGTKSKFLPSLAAESAFASMPENTPLSIRLMSGLAAGGLTGHARPGGYLQRGVIGYNLGMLPGMAGEMAGVPGSEYLPAAGFALGVGSRLPLFRNPGLVAGQLPKSLKGQYNNLNNIFKKEQPYIDVVSRYISREVPVGLQNARGIREFRKNPVFNYPAIDPADKSWKADFLRYATGDMKNLKKLHKVEGWAGNLLVPAGLVWGLKQALNSNGIALSDYLKDLAAEKALKLGMNVVIRGLPEDQQKAANMFTNAYAEFMSNDPSRLIQLYNTENPNKLDGIAHPADQLRIVLPWANKRIAQYFGNSYLGMTIANYIAPRMLGQMTQQFTGACTPEESLQRLTALANTTSGLFNISGQMSGMFDQILTSVGLSPSTVMQMSPLTKGLLILGAVGVIGGGMFGSASLGTLGGISGLAGLAGAMGLFGSSSGAPAAGGIPKYNGPLINLPGYQNSPKLVALINYLAAKNINPEDIGLYLDEAQGIETLYSRNQALSPDVLEKFLAEFDQQQQQQRQ